MRLRAANEPLRLEDLPVPVPADRQVLVRVSVCAVCRTDLHIVGGELIAPRLPLVIGHMVVGHVESAGHGAYRFEAGERIGIPWLASVDETCRFCRGGLENLCVNARFTGFHVDGGYAEYCVADERFCFPLPESYDDLHAAPLLCAGLIGYRALQAAGDAQRIGLYGFGDSAHIIAQVARYQGRRVFAFTSPGDTKKQAFARSLGAEWAGDSLTPPPEPLDAALIFAPVGALVPAALKALDPGGVVVCAGIHMSDIPSFPYELLWMERQIRSIANLTRRDGEEFLQVAPRVPVRTDVHPYPLAEANRAMDDLANGRFEGAAVLTVAAG
ncbi:MAG TPA: zinc-dependent alcohol dehydrogenase family protein [Candidatus Acidoferrum sp.]|nr:zinc-dependent alcohol dehydrogenase family protein [Candidatus Acidoferrum sp.]